ncbi:uncharacterized protein [Nicotiana tomentosiformis]|uniref:uncharacterized protein n=1 Tax=Nicotiana tomentosiformis TaxID=4098 RepID=UPI00388CE361
MTRERVSGATFDEVVDIARQIEVVHSQERGEREAKRPHGPGDFSGVLSGGQFYCGTGRPYRHAQTGHPVHRGASSNHGSFSSHQGQLSLGAVPAHSSSRAPLGQGSFASGASSSYYGSQGPIQSAPPLVPGSFFECGEFGHMWRQCPHRSGGPVQQRNAVITSIVSVCDSEASILFDPGSTYSYVSSYFTHYLDMPHTPTIDSVPVVRDFPNVFTADLLVSSEGIKVDPKKIEAVKSWPNPSSIIEIQSFLGLASDYCRFVEGFSSIASPMTKLTKKGAPFRWSDECEVIFQKLKTALAKAPVLVLPTGKVRASEDYFKDLKFRSGNGNTLPWTS